MTFVSAASRVSFLIVPHSETYFVSRAQLNTIKMRLTSEEIHALLGYLFCPVFVTNARVFSQSSKYPY